MTPPEYKRKKRSEAVEILGGKCYLCGFEDKRALQIDHVNNDGRQERKKMVAVHNKIIKDPNARPRYQILCANCNWIKHFINRKNRFK